MRQMSESANTLGLGLVRQPKAVLLGPGQRRRLATIVKGVSEEVLVVTDERMAASPAFAEIISSLETAGIRISLSELVERVAAQRRALLPLDRWAERVAWRDRRLMSLFRHRKAELQV
jgi:hypothetical protein